MHVLGDLTHRNAHFIGHGEPGPELVFGVFFWYLLVTVVPFLVVSWRMPNTYLNGGVRRGTATQIPRDPGQPLTGPCRGFTTLSEERRRGER